MANMFLTVLSLTAVYLVVQVTSNSEPLESKNVLLDLLEVELAEGEDASDDNAALVKRADVSMIRHLYDEARVNPHSQSEKDAILNKHREYRKAAGASNMEYMVSFALKRLVKVVGTDIIFAAIFMVVFISYQG